VTEERFLEDKINRYDHVARYLRQATAASASSKLLIVTGIVSS
jgi:hypothetical protein